MPLSRSKEKMHINVVVIGHVDSGKSTTTGKLTSNFDSTCAQDTHNTYRPLDLQVRRYRQAYHREVREGEHIFAVFPLISALIIIISALSPSFAPRWGNPSLRTNVENFAPGPFGDGNAKSPNTCNNNSLFPSSHIAYIATNIYLYHD
jgi:hypothetical protein